MSEDWVLAGRYRVDAPIGSGGMGEVWRGYDVQLDRRVAIKLMHRSPLGSAGRTALSATEADALDEAAGLSRERFLREIRTTARLDHPGIPAVHDFGVEASTGRIYLVMQLLYGQTLAELTGPERPVDWTAAVGAQVASTLVEVHGVDVVHRDIKPSNVMVTNGGVVKLLDFGVAVLQGAAALPRLTQIGQTVGSPPYMSPEQSVGNPVGPPTDVYALACVLHELLTARVPFLDSPTRSYQHHHVHTPPSSIRLLRADVPAGLDDLLLEMLAKEPADRPTAERIYATLLPLITTDTASTVDEDGDPRRPFLRPLAPTQRRRAAAAVVAPPPAEPLDIDEAIAVRDKVRGLVEDSQWQQAIDLLDDAVARTYHDADLELELSVDLATTLYAADEFGRAAVLLDRILPRLAHRDGENDPAVVYLHYAAGVSHAEAGHPTAALAHLSAYLEQADPADGLRRDARYQHALVLCATGRTDEGVAELESLRPAYIAEYGADSVHARALDRRIEQLRRNTGLS